MTALEQAIENALNELNKRLREDTEQLKWCHSRISFLEKDTVASKNDIDALKQLRDAK